MRSSARGGATDLRRSVECEGFARLASGEDPSSFPQSVGAASAGQHLERRPPAEDVLPLSQEVGLANCAAVSQEYCVEGVDHPLPVEIRVGALGVVEYRVTDAERVHHSPSGPMISLLFGDYDHVLSLEYRARPTSAGLF